MNFHQLQKKWEKLSPRLLSKNYMDFVVAREEWRVTVSTFLNRPSYHAVDIIWNKKQTQCIIKNTLVFILKEPHEQPKKD